MRRLVRRAPLRNQRNRATAKPDEPQLAAFLRGYGLSPKEMAAIAQELRVLAALREVDTLRWAIEKEPEKTASLAERARTAVANLDQVSIPALKGET